MFESNCIHSGLFVLSALILNQFTHKWIGLIFLIGSKQNESSRTLFITSKIATSRANAMVFMVNSAREFILYPFRSNRREPCAVDLFGSKEHFELPHTEYPFSRVPSKRERDAGWVVCVTVVEAWRTERRVKENVGRERERPRKEKGVDGPAKGVDISEKGREPTKMGREGKRVLTRVNESLVRLCKSVALYMYNIYVRAYVRGVCCRGER